MSKIVCIVTYKKITDEAKLTAYAAMAPATVQNVRRQIIWDTRAVWRMEAPFYDLDIRMGPTAFENMSH